MGTIVDVNAAKTTITVWDNYEITANFEEESSGEGCFIATAAYGTPNGRGDRNSTRVQR